jgi:hypothetical protein
MLRTKGTSSIYVYLPMPRRVFLTPQAEAKTIGPGYFVRATTGQRIKLKFPTGKREEELFTALFGRALLRCH